ncbi:MAG TPA: DoxX family protein [Beijerinckiaceae bacterium]|nr:DoxX family protein [Beijerinckiaceae bacterium]
MTAGMFNTAISLFDRIEDAFSRIPHTLIALVGRIAIAGTFWKSGQTKVQGFALDLFEGRFELGWPRFADSTVDLFRDEYKLPLLPPEFAALAATLAEHFFPVLILIGLATRLSAAALLVMTLVIQVFVYPSAWAIHGTWAAVLLWLMSGGAGTISVDHMLRKRFG